MALEVNQDNIVRILDDDVLGPGFFRLDQLVVYNATVSVTKCRFFRSDDTAVDGVDLLTADALTSAGAWVAGDGTASDPAFDYDDTSTYKAETGARYLVIWNDADNDDAVDSGEYYKRVIYNVGARAAEGQYGTLEVDTGDFEIF